MYSTLKQEKWEQELNQELMRELRKAERQGTYDPIAIKGLKGRMASLPLLSRHAV